MSFRLPTRSQRIAIIGRTGSGKTVFGAWTLALAPFHLQPYIIVDYKGDELLNGVERIRRLELSDKIPTRPGVYLVQPRPQIDDEKLGDFFYKIWDQEKVGLFLDEAFMVPTKGGALEGILTQGRSLKIPVIALTQRPAWISRYFFSEADFFAVFHLNVADDRTRVRQITGGDLDTKLPDFHSRYYDVGRDEMTILKPVPEPSIIQQMLHDRLKPETTRMR